LEPEPVSESLDLEPSSFSEIQSPSSFCVALPSPDLELLEYFPELSPGPPLESELPESPDLEPSFLCSFEPGRDPCDTACDPWELVSDLDWFEEDGPLVDVAEVLMEPAEVLTGALGEGIRKGSTRMHFPATNCCPPACRMRSTLLRSAMTTKPMLPGRTRDRVTVFSLRYSLAVTFEWGTSTLSILPKSQ
jgi:hypothetical protein